MSYETTECYDLVKELFYPTQPKWNELTFKKEAWMKLMCYINLIGEFEITGFGRVVNNEIVDIKILKQSVKSTTVDCNLNSMQEFLMSIPKEELGEWILDWHSHVNMGVFASGTDTANYQEQFKARLNNQYPLLIVNKKQECFARCYISPSKQTEIKLSIKAEDIPEERLREIYEECKQNIEEMCTKYTYKETKQSSVFPYNNYYENDYDSDDYSTRYDYTYSRQTNLFNKKDFNKIDLSKYKKKGLANLLRKNEKNSCDLQENNLSENEHCISCGYRLEDNEEIERKICNDCWEMMTPSDKAEWILNMK